MSDTHGPAPDGEQAPEHGRGDLLRGMRHELRTPVNHIIGYSEMLIEGAEDQDLDPFLPELRQICAAGRRLVGLINESLDPAAIEARERDRKLSRPNLNTPLTEILDLTATLQTRAAEQGRAEIAPDLERIGLAATQMLALIATTFGDGNGVQPSILTLTSDARAAIAVPPPLEQRTDAAPLVGRLLVVDDNELNRDMLSRRLERLGYTVALAEDGRQALEKVAAEPFDLILLDIMMPEMDGYEVLTRLKADPALRDLPVIVLSALDEIASAVRCIEIGADDYLPKPFDSVLLKARIGACLEKKRLRDQEATYLRQIKQAKKRADDLLHVVIPIGVALTAERDFNRLLERILLEAMTLCGADGGTLYLRTSDGRLKFEIIRNTSLKIAMGGTSGNPIPFAPLRLYNETTGEPNHHYVVTHAALTGASINIPDAYNAEGFDFDGTKSFDRQTGYRTTSLLNVTLKNNHNQVIGVLQLLNAQDSLTGAVIPFDQGQQQMIESLSSLAAAALEGYEREQRLRQQIEELRIEIDEVKKSRQVAEITETDYFQQLQEKARELRAGLLPKREATARSASARTTRRADGLSSKRVELGEGKAVYTVNGQRIHVHEEGPPHRKVALLIHGWSSSWYALSPLLPSLRERYRCIAVDLPGYGESPPPAGRASIRGYADLLAGLLQQVTDQPAVLIGHSMGGMISLTMALHEPRLIERMVLVCPTISGHLSMFINMFISPVTVLERFSIANTVVSALESHMLSLTDRLMRPASFAERTGISEEQYHRIRADVRRPGQGRVRAECFWAMRRGDLRGKLRKIAIPSLVLWGMEDNTVPLRDASVVADEWPDAELRVIPKAGHWPQFETPDVTLRHVRAFLSTPLKLLTVEF
jgi:pimeloyl-ACP methyl ester carboxylesterase/CheY-like chemotaxis protein